MKHQVGATGTPEKRQPARLARPPARDYQRMALFTNPVGTIKRTIKTTPTRRPHPPLSKNATTNPITAGIKIIHAANRRKLSKSFLSIEIFADVIAEMASSRTRDQ